MTFAYVGLGGNMGKPQRQLRVAMRLLARLPAARLSAVSPFYRSVALGCPGRQKMFCNAVAELQTQQPPTRLFRRLRKVEKTVQRRPRPSHAPRLLDVDYLMHGCARLRSAPLTLPHPRLHRRAFVLRPLCDISVAHGRQLPGAAQIQQSLHHCRQQPLARL